MPTPNSDYRENCDRALYASGEITQNLVEQLTPEINRLRLVEPTPITLYIDSLGGSIIAAETIRQLITAQHPDGHCCRLITVVTGRAASAAADLLALGDYAIAYPHAQIAYHGSRTPTTAPLTYEGATSLASNLQQTNEFFSARLARHAFPRFVLRLTQLRNEWDDFRNQPSPGSTALRSLVKGLTSHLDTNNGRMIRRAHALQMTIASLTASVAAHLRRFKSTKNWSEARFEAELLKAILNYKVRVHKAEDWKLTAKGLREVTEDFNLLNDFHFGPQKQALARWVKTYGVMFLIDAERTEYKNNHQNKSEKERIKWLTEKSRTKIQSVWYLIVSICRLLQSADYNLSPQEAYWLDLVDELPGSDLPNLRQMAESLPPTPAPTPAPASPQITPAAPVSTTQSPASSPAPATT